MGGRHPLLRVGIGGPVGSGKTALVEVLCWRLRPEIDLAAVTNDIYTREDAEFLIRRGVLPTARVRGVETGGCPHAAVRDDVSVNLEAIEDLTHQHPALRLVFVESGGDNLAASFSPDLVERFIYVIDVAGGDKIPRKGGPGIARSDLLVINKIDLASQVGASLAVMARDAQAARGDRPFVFSNLRAGEGVEEIIAHIRVWLGTTASHPGTGHGEGTRIVMVTAMSTDAPSPGARAADEASAALAPGTHMEGSANLAFMRLGGQTILAAHRAHTPVHVQGLVHGTGPWAEVALLNVAGGILEHRSSNQDRTWHGQT